MGGLYRGRVKGLSGPVRTPSAGGVRTGPRLEGEGTVRSRDPKINNINHTTKGRKSVQIQDGRVLVVTPLKHEINREWKINTQHEMFTRIFNVLTGTDPRRDTCPKPCVLPFTGSVTSNSGRPRVTWGPGSHFTLCFRGVCTRVRPVSRLRGRSMSTTTPVRVVESVLG